MRILTDTERVHGSLQPWSYHMKYAKPCKGSTDIVQHLNWGIISVN